MVILWSFHKDDKFRNLFTRTNPLLSAVSAVIMASTSNRTEEEVNGDSDELQQDSDKSQKKSAKHDSGASDLEKVTDFMEEKEIKHSEFLEGVCVFTFRSQHC